MGQRILSNDNGGSGGFIGVYSFVVPEDRVYGDAVVASVFGLEPHLLAEGAPIADVIRYVKDGDRQRLAKALHEAIVTGNFYEETYTIIHPDGREVSVSAVGRCLRDAKGLPWIYSGTLTIENANTLHGSDNLLQKHCHAALDIARTRRHSLAARYLSSALSVLTGRREI